MSNINRDYLVVIHADFTSDFIGDRFKLVKRDEPMRFKRHDRNSENFFIVITGMDDPTLTLTMGLVAPSGKVDIYTPELIDIKDDVFIYEVKLRFKEIGVHKYQFFITDGTRKISSDIDKLVRENCL